jgi:hypothetical protein
MLCGVEQLMLSSKVSTGHLDKFAGHQTFVARRFKKRLTVQDSVRTHSTAVVSSLYLVSSALIGTFEEIQ